MANSRKNCSMGFSAKTTSFALAIVLACGICIPLFGCNQSSAGGSASSPGSAQSESSEALYTEYVAKNATVAHLRLQADSPLAQEIKPESIALDGAFAGFAVGEVVRVDDATLDLVVSLPDGTKATDSPYGYVMLDAAAFAEPQESSETTSSGNEAFERMSGEAESSAASSLGSEASGVSSGESEDVSSKEASQGGGAGSNGTGSDAVDADTFDVVQTIALSVSDPLATILPLEGSYDSQAGVFLLPISLGYAEYTRAPEAADFKLSDASLEIAGVDYDESSRSRATLHIAVAPDDLVGTFDALDAALTKSGIEVAEDATNCGALSIGSNDMRAAKREGYETTALACLSPNARAVVDGAYTIESKTQDDDGLTDYDVHLKTTIESQPGSCSLPAEGIDQVVRVDSAAQGDQVLGEETIRIDDTSLFLNVRLSGAVVDALADGQEADDVSEAADAVARFARAHKLVLPQGCLSNAWGVPLPETEVQIYLNSEQTSADEEADAAAFKLVEEAYADEEDPERTEKAFEIISLAFEAAGGFAEAAAGEPGGALEGVAGLFGIVSTAVGFGDGDLYTLEDVMDKLDSMDEELKSIDAKISGLSKQLDGVEKRLSYREDLNELRKCLTRTEIYNMSLQETLWNKESKVEWPNDPKGGIAGLSEEQKDIIAKFVKKASEIQSPSPTGYGYNVLEDTIKLGNLMAGDSSLAAKSVILEFYDCMDTLLNWEPEAYPYRQTFMARLEYAYLCGYTTAVTQLQWEAYKSGDPDVYEDRLTELIENYQKVQTAVIGKTTYKKKEKIQVEESPLVTATRARNDGKVKNLVTGDLFGKDSIFMMYGADGFGDGYLPKEHDAASVRTYKFDGALNRSDFETMVGRLKAGGYDTVWDEMVGMFGNSNAFTHHFPDWTEQGWVLEWNDGYSYAKIIGPGGDVWEHPEDLDKWRARIILSSADRHTVHDQKSVRHTYSWTGDYFDMQANEVHTGVELYNADETYLVWPPRWKFKATFNPYHTTKAVD